MEIAGKRVVDAKTPLHITVTKRDASLGKTKDPGGCAAARAIVRTLADAKGARVHLGRTYIEFPDKWVRYQTPECLRTEIVAFDRGANPEYTQGNYVLRPPSPSGRLDARPKPAGKTGGASVALILRASSIQSRACVPAALIVEAAPTDTE